jgi:hypothetical protein
MVVKRGLLLAIATTATLVLTAAMPVAAVFEPTNPNPLGQDRMLRALDIAARGATAAGPVSVVGWRQASDPASLFMGISLDGGKSYLRTNGNLRKYRVIGDGRLGMSLDVCGGRVWAGSVVIVPRASDPKSTTHMVALSSRTIGGGAGQAFVTKSTAARKIRDVSIACVGNKLLAVGWLEFSKGTSKARLELRSLGTLGEVPAFRKVYGLGPARFKGGLAVAATSNGAHVAWSKNTFADIAYKRFLIGKGTKPPVSKVKTRIIATKDATSPTLAARGGKVAVGYTDNGKVRVRLSSNRGKNFTASRKIVGAGTVKAPSKIHSIDISGNQVVAEVSANRGGALTPRRVRSTNLGGTWTSAPFGHKGARFGALIKQGGDYNLLELWHDNGPASDTLRSQFER